MPIAIVALLVLLFTWNNYSLFIGGLTASGSASYRLAVALVAAAMVFGVLTEGWKMMPTALSAGAYEPALITTIIVFGVSNVLNVPVSISNILVVGLSGSSMANGVGVNVGFLAAVILAWLLSPIAAMVLTWIIYKLVHAAVQRSGLLLLDLFNRSAAYVVTLYASYTLAANNIGFIVNMVPGNRSVAVLVVLLAAVAGMLMTRRAYVAMGEGLVSLSPQRYFTSVFAASIVLWLLTQLGIPAALTQLLMGAFLGAIISSTLAIYNVRRFKLIVVSWIATAALSFPAGYFIALVMA